MSLTIRERLALQDAADRRALSQRMLRAGEVRNEQHESNVESLRAMSMLAGVIFACAIALLCIVAGIAVADWWSGGAAFVASVPAGGECMR